MPVARFQMQDGRVARFEVPDGTTPEQAQSMVSQYLARSQPTQNWRNDPIVSPPKRSKAAWENDPIITPAPKARGRYVIEEDAPPEAAPSKRYVIEDSPAPTQVMGAYDDILYPKQAKRGAYDDILQDAPKPDQGVGAYLRDTVVDTAAGLGKGVGEVALGAQHYLGKAINAVTPSRTTLSTLVTGEKKGNAVGDWLINDAAQGRKKLAGELAPHKARSPIAAPVGEISGNIVATLPVGGALAKGVQSLPMLSKVPAATKFANTLRSGGFSTGAPAATTFAGRAADMGIRSAGGGITGGVMAGLADPETAGTGAAIGALLPPSLKVAAKARQLVKRGAGAVASNVLGASTGTGAESVRAAYGAGKKGSTKFLDNMRGKVSFDDVVDDAKSALSKMRADRAEAYRSGMVDIRNDATVIDFKPIHKAVTDLKQMGSFKGQQINKNAAATVDDIAQTVDNWASLNPAEYHTPEGLDALKQAIGDIRDSTQFGTAARRAADTAYNAVKNEIVAKAPTYSKVMKDYSEASALLKEIESGLSLGSKGNASKDAAVRKLQSLLRNNAQTNYGNRLNLARQLKEKGGADLMPALAGQSMSSAMPRGLSGGIQKAGALGIGVTSPTSIPALLAAAPFTSPRLVGEGLYGLGRLTSVPANLLSAGKQGANRLAVQHPGLLDLENALYRSLPIMATSLGQRYGENHE